MSPHANKYGGANNKRKKILEKRRKQRAEKRRKQRAAEIKVAFILAIIAIAVQSIAFILALIPSIISYTIIPGILGLLIGGIAVGLIHTDKRKKLFVYVVFLANILIGIFSGYQFIESQKPAELTKEEIKKYKTLNQNFQEKIREQTLVDSLKNKNTQQANSTINNDTIIK